MQLSLYTQTGYGGTAGADHVRVLPLRNVYLASALVLPASSSSIGRCILYSLVQRHHNTE